MAVTGQSSADEAQGRYRQLLETAPDAMLVVGPDGVISFANIATERLFGYSRAELLGSSLDMLVPERFRKGHASHLQRFFEHPTRRPMGSGIELFGVRKDGVELPIEVSLSPLHSAEGTSVSAAIRDISERKRMESAVRVNAVRLRVAVETMQDALALFDADDRLVLCNGPYRHLLGDLPADALVGKSYEELLDLWITTLVFASGEQRDAFRSERLAARREPKG